MTTYGGRSASYVPGKEVVNKEPPVSRYVVEKLYRVHRERLMKVEPTIDSHVKIPDFLVNQTWKKNAEKQKLVVIARENQDIYGRIAKVENSESLITRENKVHVKRVESKLSYLRKLKEHGRLVNMLKIQRENELFLKRLEKANPQYTLKACKDWYRHHERFKAGRRTDPTAGHIMHNMKGLLPASLPPLSSTLSGSLDRTEAISGLDRKKLPGIGQGLMRSSTSNSMLSSIASDRDGGDSPFPDLPSPSKKPGTTGQLSARSNSTAESRRKSRDHGKDREVNAGLGTETEEYEFEENYDESDADSQFTHDSNTEDLMLIASRPMAIPFDSKNCLVQVYAPRAYDENLRLRVISSGINSQKLFERDLPIDKAHEIVNTLGQSSQIMHTTDNEDLQSLSTMLINMFKEADDDGSGSLTFDEFQKLMEQVELGISAQELRFVISEADENENGVVDYEEFVPLAVDLIQSFRARNRAKTMNSQEDVLVDDQILSTISSTELKGAAEKCLAKIHEFDSKKYGLIRVPDLKKCLNAIAMNIGISENEISMLCQLLPRDQFGRIKYNATPTTLFDALSRVRFMTMKNAIIESKGSGLQKYLLDLCKEEEKKLANFNVNSKEKFVPSGIIPCRSLINILSNSPRLSLSRLQVLVIMSEASVLDGMINYFQFIPVVAKAIEIMFEPKALRQRAELIEKTDLSPEALLQGMSSEMFEQRLLTLFKSYDIDHNGTLDQNEFIACLESLDLQLSYGEMVALMAAADVAQHGFLKFEDFVGFFTHNLLNLEREKHIRLLQSSLHKNKNNDIMGTDESDDLTKRLLALFRLSDPGHTGYIPFDDFESILQNLSINTSKFLIDVLLSELHVNNDGLVEYETSLKTCTDLFRVYKAKETVMEETKAREKAAEEKAVKITEACSDEIQQIVRYLMKKFKSINEHASLSPIAKYLEIQEAIRSPNSGLSRNESNMILTKLFIGINDNRIHHSRAPSLDQNDYSPNAQVQGIAMSPSNAANMAALAAVAAAAPGGGASSSVNSGFTPPPLSIPSIEYTPVRNNVHTPKFRNSIKSLKFQFSTQELQNAIFEAKKITIMRSLLQEIDIDSTQSKILSLLQEELLKRQKNNEISPDSTYLPVSSCYLILENIHELRLNRAQIMFLISLADCYDRDGKTLEIYRFAEHASAIIAHLNDSEVLETRAEVMNLTVIDDRKTFQGLREREFVDELTNHIQATITQRKHLLKELEANHNVYIINKKVSGIRSLGIREDIMEDADGDGIVTLDEHVNAEDKKRLQEEDDERLAEGHGHSSTKVQEDVMDENEKKFQLYSRLDDSTISRDELMEILRTLPRQKLTDREVNTIIAGLRVPVRLNERRRTMSGGNNNDDEIFDVMRASAASAEVEHLEIINWQDLLLPLVESLRSYAREHLIHRRVSLVATSNSMNPINNENNNANMSTTTPRSATVHSVSAQSETSTKSQKFQEDAIKSLKQLAEKLLNYVKIISSSDGGVSLSLPTDTNNPAALRRTSSQILSKDDLKANTSNHTEIMPLFRCSAFIKFITTRLVTLTPIVNDKHNKDRKFTKDFSSSGPSSANASTTNLLSSMNSNNMSSSNLNTSSMQRQQSIAQRSVSSPSKPAGIGSQSGNNLLELVNLTTGSSSAPGTANNGSSSNNPHNSYVEVVKEHMTPMFVQILAIEDTRFYSSCTLVANFITPTGDFCSCETLSMKLPTIGLVDEEAAKQFAANLVERMYFEMDEKERKPVLRMNESV